MYVTYLKLTNFRNYESFTEDFSQGVHFIVGENAQGKTNLIEAIGLCSVGRSHRTKKEKELIRWGQTDARVELGYEKNGIFHKIVFKLHEKGKREILVDDLPLARVGELMGRLSVVLFAPEDLSLVKEGPDVRRRFMDREISQLYPAYFYALQRYARALKQKNALLRQAVPSRALEAQLSAFDELLAQNGAYILEKRLLFCENIAKLAKARHSDLTNAKEALSLSYAPNLPEKCVSKEEYMQALAAFRRAEIERKSSLAGIHRDDLSIAISQKSARSFASQGQQRTAAISLKLSELSLAHQITGAWPVLLLDDILSELDEHRQRFLSESTFGIQTFITTTHVPQTDKGRIFTIQGGRCVEKLYICE